MRKYFKFTAIALLTTALSALPASALSLNLGGGGPIVDLGNGNNATGTVGLDTGNLLGGSGDDDTSANGSVNLNLGNIGGDGGVLGGTGDLVDLDGDGPLLNLGGSDDGAIINLGNTGNGLVDLGDDGNLLDLGGGGNLVDFNGDGPLLDLGAGDDGAIVNLGGVDEGGLLDLGQDGDLLDFGDGPLLDLTGDGGGDVDIALLGDTGVIGLDSSGNLGGVVDLDGTDGLLDLGGTDGLLDLGETGSIAGLRAARLVDFNSTDPLLNLDADEDESIVNLGSTDGLLGTGDGLLDLGSGGEQLTALNLLGTDIGVDLGSDGGPVSVSVGTDGDGGLLGDNNVTISLGGSSGGGGTGGGGDGGDGGNGGNGGNGGGGNGGGAGGGAGGNGSGGVLAAAADDACLSLTPSQLQQLVKRHVYNRATFNSWASARSLKIVEVNLCEAQVTDVSMTVDTDANVARLQAFLAAQAKVRAGLQSRGYAPGDVIAADHDGSVLIVYVL